MLAQAFYSGFAGEHQDVGLWGFEKRPLPKAKAPPSEYYACEQIPSYDCADPDYSFEAYI
jgi:hypothetical protein